MSTYLTLDYELFMGASGTPEKCLIEPMNYLVERLDNYNVKLNVFVDAAYLIRLRELRSKYIQLEHDYDLVVRHIKELDEGGHAIQLHLHPQWLYSNYDGHKWVLDTRHYKLSDLDIDHQKELISDSVQLLNSLISRKVSAYRGGGYCVDSFRDLYSSFLSSGVHIDTSVLRGEKNRVSYKKYDYRHVPLMTSYPISGDVTEVDYDGKMMEYPISTIVVPAWKYLLNRRKRDVSPEFSSAKWGDGKGMGYRGNKMSILLSRSGMLFGKKCIRASIDGDGSNLEKVYLYCQSHYKGEDFVVIGHPKLITPLSVHNLELFILNHPEADFKLF